MKDVNVGKLLKTPREWLRSTGGSNSTQPTVSSIIDGVTTYKNPFTHTDIVSAHCVTSSIAGAMFEMGFPFQIEAMDFFPTPTRLSQSKDNGLVEQNCSKITYNCRRNQVSQNWFAHSRWYFTTPTVTDER